MKSSGTSVIGMVERLYVTDRFSKDLFLDIKIHKPGAGQELWTRKRLRCGARWKCWRRGCAVRARRSNDRRRTQS